MHLRVFKYLVNFTKIHSSVTTFPFAIISSHYRIPSLRRNIPAEYKKKKRSKESKIVETRRHIFIVPLISKRLFRDRNIPLTANNKRNRNVSLSLKDVCPLFQILRPQEMSRSRNRHSPHVTFAV